MCAQNVFYPDSAGDIAPARGKLGVLLPGLGAVSTTLIAGVQLINKGLAKPYGSLTQMQRIRLGPRHNPRFALIKDLVPLADLTDLSFGGWDIFPENAYQTAAAAGVLPLDVLDQVRKELKAIQPWPGVFERAYVRNLDGRHVKRGPTKMHLAEAIMGDIDAFLTRHSLRRAVMIWCGSTEVYLQAGRVHESIAAFEWGLKENAPEISPSMIYAYAALARDIPFVNGAPNLSVDIPALVELAAKRHLPIAGKDLKTGQTSLKTIIAPGLKARSLGLSGWFSTNILGNRDGEVLDDPGSFRTKEVSKSSVLDAILQPELYADLYGRYYHKVRIEYYPPRGDAKEGWDNIDIFGWLGQPMQIKINFLCRDSILAAPLVLDLILLLDLAKRADLSGVQDWLSFYFKSPMSPPTWLPNTICSSSTCDSRTCCVGSQVKRRCSTIRTSLMRQPTTPQGSAPFLNSHGTRGGLPLRLARPFKIIAFDWDGTAVMHRREDAACLRALVEKLLRLGVSVVIITATTFSNIEQQLTATLRSPHKHSLYVSTNRGSEVYGFDAQSQPVLLWQRLATPEESRLLAEIVHVAGEAVVARTGLEIRVVDDRMNRGKLDLMPLPAWHDQPKSAMGEVQQAVEARLKGAGLSNGLQEVLQLVEQTALEKGLRGVRLTTDAKQVEVGLTDKSDAMDWLIRELARGLNVAPEHMLIAGDEFGPIAGLEGSDHKMVTLQAKEAIFISVGAEPWGMPPEVMHLGGGPARFRALLAHQAALLERLHRPLTSGVVPKADRRSPAGPLPSAPSPLRSLPV